MALQDPSLQDDLLEGFESVSLAPQRSESRSTMGGRDHPALHPSPPTGEVPQFQFRSNTTTKSKKSKNLFSRLTDTSALNRLVIAIDYGTTFTGKESPFALNEFVIVY